MFGATRFGAMSDVPSVAAQVTDLVRQAMVVVVPSEVTEIDPLIRRSERADFQANGMLPLAKTLRTNPRQIAEQVVAALADGDLIAASEVSGPGFVNLTISDRALLRQLTARLSDPRLGVPTTESGQVTVIDYSQPNIAKEMHVGHLRSTIIGDALVRCLEFVGGTVIRQNHLGDWGTQFGMLIQYLFEHPQVAHHAEETGPEAMSRLNTLYRAARTEFTGDPEFAERARRRVVELQAGDPETLGGWRDIVAESKIYFNDIYARLDVLLTDDDAVGESFYNPVLPEIAADLEKRGIAVRSEGALCVFFDDILGPDDKPVPLIIQKSDGGFGYAATDMAAIRHRVSTLGAGRILYVVDSRQALHFRMVFAAARRAGYLPDTVEAVHVSFGSVLGPDGKPFKTRAGDTVRLIELLDQAVDRAKTTVLEKNREQSSEMALRRAREVGIGAVKYADLTTSRTRDYLFDLDRMVSLTGNTGVYLQYAHARVRSILAKAAEPFVVAAHIPLEPAERSLLLLLDEFSATVSSVTETFEPHRLCGYLYDLAQAFTTFYEACPVLRAPTPAVRGNRLALCQLTGDTIERGLALLGIAAPRKL